MKFLKNKKVIIGLAVVAVVVFVYFISRDKGPEYEYAVASRGNIVQEVSVTGRVKPAEAVNLAFEVSGRVAGINFKVGDAVYVGSLLVSLNSSSLAAELAKVEADLSAQKAKLFEVNTTLENLYSSALNVLNDVYLKADDAVRAKTTGMFSGSRSSAYNLTFSTCDEAAKVKAIAGKLLSEDQLDEWKIELGSLDTNSSFSERNEAMSSGRGHLTPIAGFLDDLSKALNADCIIGDSSLDTYRTNLSTARTNVRTAITAVSDKEQAIALQQAVISSNEATEKSYEASVANIKAQLAKTRLYSPIRGVVTAMEAEVGELASAGEVIVSVISASQFEIEADIPEADVAKVKVGDSARVTLDAYGSGVIFEAAVVQIDPAEKIIEGVPTYRTKLQFKERDERVKSGMTANIDVLAAQKENVIYVPQRAVVSDGGRTYVRVPDGKTPKEIDVQTGLRGSDGNVEIVSGLNEGDRTIVFEK